MVLEARYGRTLSKNRAANETLVGLWGDIVNLSRTTANPDNSSKSQWSSAKFISIVLSANFAPSLPGPILKAAT